VNKLFRRGKRWSHYMVWGLLALAVAAFVLVQGCADGNALEVGRPAPDFTLEDLDGNVVRLNDLQSKVVFINFWATWCPPCRAEMPEIEALHQEYKDEGVVVIGVAISEPENTVRQYIQQGGFNWTIVLDKTGEVASDYQITAIPVSYFLDKEGIIRAVNVGAMTKSEMEAEVNKAMR
jgi:peroxiredoxin